MLQQFGRVIDECGICHYHDNLSYLLLIDTSDVPYGTPAECLIAEFNQKIDVSFWCVLHYINYGFATLCKEHSKSSRVKK